MTGHPGDLSRERSHRTAGLLNQGIYVPAPCVKRERDYPAAKVSLLLVGPHWRPGVLGCLCDHGFSAARDNRDSVRNVTSKRS